MGKKRNRNRSNKDEINPINAAVVMTGLLAAGVYILMKGCETYERSQGPSPLEEKIRHAEVARPVENNYAISDDSYKH